MKCLTTHAKQRFFLCKFYENILPKKEKKKYDSWCWLCVNRFRLYRNIFRSDFLKTSLRVCQNVKLKLNGNRSLIIVKNLVRHWISYYYPFLKKKKNNVTKLHFVCNFDEERKVIFLCEIDNVARVLSPYIFMFLRRINAYDRIVSPTW